MTFARRIPLIAGSLTALALCALAFAQIEGNDRGVPPIDSSANYEVGGIAVDVSARTADQARTFGWRLAQRRGWKQLWARANGQPPDAAPGLSDGQLDQIVAGIAVENEQIGSHRYIARLGVLFDRTRAGDFLGQRGGGPRSAPMLVIPVMWSGGSPQSFEHRTEWQKAWARFRSGGSPIDYIRPYGNGIDPLRLNVAQAERPGRSWWRMLLDQYAATDVVIPTVRLQRRWPGGPVAAHFTAIHGPDGAVVAEFDLAAPSSDEMPRMLDEGVRRIDLAYAQALREGNLGADRSLVAEPAAVPELPEEAPVEEDAATTLAPAPAAAAVQALTLQAETPDDAAEAQAEAALRGVSGVRGVTVASLALGGISVLRVQFEGDAVAFRQALAARGLRVEDAGGALACGGRRNERAEEPGGVSQIALPLDWPAAADERDFLVSPANEAVVRHFERWGIWPVMATILLGPRKSGRSLLGRIVAARTGGELADDAENWDEEALFHAWNRAQERRRPLVIVADRAPPAWPVALPDLASRLAATPRIVLGGPDADLTARLIEKLAVARGLAAPPEVIRYLVPRLERSYLGIHRAIEALDELALEKRQGLTVPLARAALLRLGMLRDVGEGD